MCSPRVKQYYSANPHKHLDSKRQRSTITRTLYRYAARKLKQSR